MGADLLLLRDSNWSPDFPTSALVARALYAQDRGIDTDGAIALDMEAVRLLVEALGPLQMPRYTATDHRREYHRSPQTGVGVSAYDSEHDPAGRHVELVGEAQGFHGHHGCCGDGEAARRRPESGRARRRRSTRCWMAGICRSPSMTRTLRASPDGTAVGWRPAVAERRRLISLWSTRMSATTKRTRPCSRRSTTVSRPTGPA